MADAGEHLVVGTGRIDAPGQMVLASERLAHRGTAELLSCKDLVGITRHKLSSKIETDAALVAKIEGRHRRRRTAMVHAYRKQASEPGISVRRVNLTKK